MKLGIMQPYFFPYIGYFQLINAVDKFVIYNDINFIKQGRDMARSVYYFSTYKVAYSLSET